MQNLSLVLTFLFSSCSILTSDKTDINKHVWPTKNWEYVKSFEQVGWSKSSLEEARNYTKKISTAAVVIVSKGKILKEWGEVNRKFRTHSIRKSLLNAIIGIEVDNGHIDLHKNLGQIGIDDNYPLSKKEKSATIDNLLTARSCVFHPTYTKSIPYRDSCKPGNRWYYNSWDFNVLGTIYEKESGLKLFESFYNRLAQPLQMESYQVNDGKNFPQRFSKYPAYKFKMTARDLARFGLLFLRKGNWRGKQILSRKWVHDSTKTHTTLGELGGYGYMWWTENNGKIFPGMKMDKGVFLARGLNGHFIYVDPNIDLLIVHRVNTFDEKKHVSIKEFSYFVQKVYKSII